ncbi:YlmH family RNA-binding protein [Enterococcus sp. CSURQ0835]|uniref:YlmH family RNA-binding protein n=1 Tax=Enterococcus sp. CSURQ0835 TaxID=2681394 RepID=UPI00135B996B|nr:RNA-binding protein [Enterococcus sp. CSURQ0835]
MNTNVYQHFRPEEHPFIDAVGDWLEQVESQYAPYLTNFLDPRQAYILETLIRENSELQFKFYGGYEQAERCRCLIYPEYYEPTDADFELVMIEIKYPHKFAQLSHGKILGTMMSTGVKREFFGDIISDGERWQVFLANEIANYIETQVTKIGKVTVHFEERPYTELIVPKDSWTEESATASSLRLDVVISTVYNISRQRSKQLVESGKIKVNWMPNERPDYSLDLLDIVSIRGFGRIQIQGIEGTTKKGKIRLQLGVLRK